MSEDVLIVGTGAQAKYALETFRLRSRGVVGLLALKGVQAPDAIDGAAVLGTLEDFARVSVAHRNPQVLLACSSNELKAQIEQTLSSHSPIYTQAIHPAATIARTASLGVGAIVNATAVIQPFARIGRHAMIHAGAIVEHDVQVGDFVNIAPRACLTGHVRVGDGSTIFAGAVVTPSVCIGARVIVGAGAVVLESVPDDMTVAGVPAKPLPRRAHQTEKV